MKEWLLVVVMQPYMGTDAPHISINPEDLGYPRFYESSELDDCRLNSKLINVEREMTYDYKAAIFGDITKSEKLQFLHGYCVEIQMPE